MSKELNKMLASPTKGVEEARGVLARLFRKILMDRNIGPIALNNLMIRWLEDPRNHIPNNGKSRSSERGNLIKEITRPDMTWKVFLKCIRFLRPLEVGFQVYARWTRTETTITTIKLPFSSEIYDEDLNEEPAPVQYELFDADASVGADPVKELEEAMETFRDTTQRIKNSNVAVTPKVGRVKRLTGNVE